MKFYTGLRVLVADYLTWSPYAGQAGTVRMIFEHKEERFMRGQWVSHPIIVVKFDDGKLAAFADSEVFPILHERP